MAKHLTLSDRIVIERGINNELTFATIAGSWNVRLPQFQER